MNWILLKILNALFPPERPSEADRLNYYADTRCKTCAYRLQCVEPETTIESTLTEAEKQAIHLEYVKLHSPIGSRERVSTSETQPIPVEQIRRMKRHGSME